MAADFQVYNQSGDLVVSGSSRLTRILLQIPVVSPLPGTATFDAPSSSVVACSAATGSAFIALLASATSDGTVSWEWDMFGSSGPVPSGISGYITVLGYQ